jgi:hypothetical protein
MRAAQSDSCLKLDIVPVANCLFFPTPSLGCRRQKVAAFPAVFAAAAALCILSRFSRSFVLNSLMSVFIS